MTTAHLAFSCTADEPDTTPSDTVKSAPVTGLQPQLSLLDLADIA